MTAPHAAWSSTPTFAIPADQARAYCGPAHGRLWPLTPGTTPPGTVDLMVDGHRALYRLVYSPRTRQPARDHLGNYLYIG
jgi:hypothetical protein